MKRPKMIIFDAGKTLINYLPKIDDKKMLYLSTIDAIEKLMPYITSNLNNYDAQDINRFTNKIFEEYSKCRKAYFEINNQVILKTVFDYLNIKLSISFSQAEKIIWNHSANIVAVEGVLELLDSLKCLGIRSAVISNLDFSGYLLEEKLNELLPNNAFEFVIASSDYGIRKPQKLIFEIGISKSGLAAEDIWYVGDKPTVDGSGSKSAGMTPIIFKSKKNQYSEIPKDMITIDDYKELIDILKNIE